MSYDLNSGVISCGHEISLERYFIDTTDFRSLRLASNPALFMRAPINGQSLVKLYISGTQVDSNHPVYGWSIVPDINRVGTDDQFYKIIFNNPVRFFIPLIEASYLTHQDYCLRCSATGSLNDIQPAPSGSVLHVVGTNKLIQSCLKHILTSVCLFYPQFTCPIKGYIGHKVTSMVTADDIYTAITTALTNLTNIQAAQQTVQTMDPFEMLRDISNLTVTMPDPMSFSVALSIISYGSLAAIPVNFTLTSSYALVGN